MSLAWILTSYCTRWDFQRNVDMATPSLKPDHLMVHTMYLPSRTSSERFTIPSKELNNHHSIPRRPNISDRVLRETFRPRVADTRAKWSAWTPFVTDTRSLPPRVLCGHYHPRRLHYKDECYASLSYDARIINVNAKLVLEQYNVVVIVIVTHSEKIEYNLHTQHLICVCLDCYCNKSYCCCYCNKLGGDRIQSAMHTQHLISEHSVTYVQKYVHWSFDEL